MPSRRRTSSKTVALERRLRELHFFLPLTRSYALKINAPRTSGARSSITPENFPWTYHREIPDVPSARQPLRRSHSLTPIEHPARPAFHALPPTAVEIQLVEELEELNLPFSAGTLLLPEDWKHSEVNLRQTDKPRDQLNHEALLMYIREGIASIHYKWEQRDFFDNLKSREANITTLEGDNWQISSHWWLLHVISYAGVHRIGDELEVDRFMTSCIAGLFQMPDFHSPHVSHLKHPLSLSPLNNIVPASIMVQMQINGWEERLSPIAFAAQRGSTNASALLASALQATLNVLILYFLSTRASADDMLPHWLFLYGISYDDDGLLIFAHYPHLVEVSADSDAILDEPVPRRWGYASVMVCDSHQKCFQRRAPPKLTLANALLIIQAHTIYLTEKLTQWAAEHRDTEHRDMELLIACAGGRRRRANHKT